MLFPELYWVSVCYCLPAVVWWCWPWYKVAGDFLSVHLLPERIIQGCHGKSGPTCISGYCRRKEHEAFEGQLLMSPRHRLDIVHLLFSVLNGALWFSLETRKVLNTHHLVIRLFLCRNDCKCNTFLPKRLCLWCFQCNCRNLLTSSRMKLYIFFLGKFESKSLADFLDMLGFQKRAKCLNLGPWNPEASFFFPSSFFIPAVMLDDTGLFARQLSQL